MKVFKIIVAAALVSACAIDSTPDGSGNIDPIAYQPDPTEVRAFSSKVYIDYPNDLRPAFRGVKWHAEQGCIQHVTITRGSDVTDAVEFSSKRCPTAAGTLASEADVTLRLILKDSGREDAQYNPIYDLLVDGARVGQVTDYLSYSTDLLAIDSLCQLGAPRFSCTVAGENTSTPSAKLTLTK